jgi:hypothetical protein
MVEAWLEHADGSDDPGFDWAECAALELRAHGASGIAAGLLEDIVARRGTAGAAAPSDGPCLWNLFSAHYYMGRWNEVATGYAQRLRQDPGDITAHSALAAVAVRRSDRAELARQSRWLARRSDSPLATLGLARVAALQGHRTEAVTLVERALQHQLERHYLHIDPDFESMRDYPPYRELIRPKE